MNKPVRFIYCDTMCI